MTNDVLVAFDATDHEPDIDHPSNVVRIFNLVSAVPLYEPGIGTRLSYVGVIGSGLGFGGSDRIDDQLDRLTMPFFRGKRVSVIGGSRGADAARRFTFEYGKRFPDRPQVHCCVLLDHVSADGWNAFKRISPRRLWDTRNYERPRAEHSLHIRAGGVSHRFYISDTVACDDVLVASGMNHTKVLHLDDPLQWSATWLALRGVS
jgi:hypothetical protein